MAILVTGATGFVGRAVVRELEALGEELVLLVREGSDATDLPGRVVRGDVSSLDDVATALHGCSSVVHMAAMVTMWHPRKERFREVNVGGLRNVLVAASYGSVDRILYTSTILALGPSGGEPADEERSPVCLTPGNLYMASKVEALELAREMASQGAPLTCLYPGIVFGPGPSREAAIMTKMLRDLLRGRLKAIVGPGDQPWCHAYVDDVARGHRLALERGAAGRDYVLGGENRTLVEWLSIACRLGGARMPRLRVPVSVAGLLGRVELLRARLGGHEPILTPDVVDVFRRPWAYSSERARAELGYTVLPLADGIGRTIAALGAP